jgi:hypothetical protein
LGTLVLQNGAMLNNATGATYNIKSNGGISGGTVLNTGILEKSAGTGTTTIATSTLSNMGTMAVTSGTLNLSAAVSQVSGSTLTAGSWTVTGSATVHSTLDITSIGSLNTIGSAAKVVAGNNGALPNFAGGTEAAQFTRRLRRAEELVHLPILTTGLVGAPFRRGGADR